MLDSRVTIALGSTGEGPTPSTLKPITPVRLIVHPCMTWTGYQPSLVFSLLNGVVVKYNLCDTAATNKCIVRAPSRAQKEPLVITDETSGGAKKKAEKDSDRYVQPASLFSYVHREFFQAHVDAVVAMTFVAATSRFYSLDAAGKICIWNEQPEMYTGFGWFAPTTTYTLDMVESTFLPRPVQLSPHVILFPIPQTKENGYDPNLPFTQSTKLKRESERKYQALVDGLDLENEPIVSRPTPEGGLAKTFMPADCNTVFDPIIACHTFTYLKYTGGGEVQVPIQHETCFYDRLQRRGMVMDACFTVSQLELVLSLFYPALSFPVSQYARNKGTMPGFEARLIVRVLRLQPEGTVTIAPFFVNIPISETLTVPPQGFGFFVSPALDVPGTDLLYSYDAKANINVYSLATGQQVKAFNPAVPKQLAEPTSRYAYALVAGHKHFIVCSSTSNAFVWYNIRDKNPVSKRLDFAPTFTKLRRAAAAKVTVISADPHAKGISVGASGGDMGDTHDDTGFGGSAAASGAAAVQAPRVSSRGSGSASAASFAAEEVDPNADTLHSRVFQVPSVLLNRSADYVPPPWGKIGAAGEKHRPLNPYPNVPLMARRWILDTAAAEVQRIEEKRRRLRAGDLPPV
jgi:hypothetical protein